MSDRSSPFDDLERLIDQLTGGIEELPVGADVPVDVEERDDAFVVRADFPGYERADVEVEVGDDHVYVGGERTAEREESSGRYVRRERTDEAVGRSIDLPGRVDPEAASATFQNGVLTVTLPKAGDDGGGHRIEIE